MNVKLKDFLLKERDMIEGFYSAYNIIKDKRTPFSSRSTARDYLRTTESWLYQKIEVKNG